MVGYRSANPLLVHDWKFVETICAVFVVPSRYGRVGKLHKRGTPNAGKDCPNRQANFQSCTHLFFSALLLTVIVLLAYTPVYRAGFVWDDDTYLTENMLLRSADGLAKIWTKPSANVEGHYWPMVYTVFWINYHLWGFAPFWYHVQNVLLHAVNVILLWALLRQLSVPGAWLAAAVFALHPVHVESVAWIIELKDVLSGMFYLSSLLLYSHFVERCTGKVDRIRLLSFYVPSLVLFACAMLSKSIAVSLPVAIIVCLWWKREPLVARDLLPTFPFFIIAAVMIALEFWALSSVDSLKHGLGLVDRVLIAGRAICFYMAKLAWPSELMLIYPRWQINWREAFQYFFPLAVAGVPAVLWLRRDRWGKGPFVGAVYFCLTLAPILGLIDHDYMAHSFVADRFQYLASVGPIVLFATGAGWLVRRLIPEMLRPATVAAAVLLLVLGTMTWRRAALFEGIEPLFQHNVDRNPSSHAAQHNLGIALSRKGMTEEAIEHYKKAIEINAKYEVAHNSLGSVLLGQGKIEEAIEHYKKAIEINPKYADPWNNLGNICSSRGRYKEAIAFFTKAIAIKPHLAAAHNNLGNAYKSIGNYKEAMASYEKATTIDPNSAEINFNVGLFLTVRGDHDKARPYLRKALSLAGESGNQSLTDRIRPMLERRDSGTD